MQAFIPREKLGKKARRELDRARRATWGIAPVTRKAPDKTKYNRKRSDYRDDDYGSRIFHLSGCSSPI